MIDEERIQLLIDKQDIYELMCRYTRGVDRFDKELVQSCFWYDATTVFPLSADSAFKGKYSDFLEIDVETWKPYTAHNITFVIILPKLTGTSVSRDVPILVLLENTRR